MRRPWIVGVSGASGTPYAAAALRALCAAGQPVDLVISRAARLTIKDETGISFRDAHWRDDLAEWLGNKQVGSGQGVSEQGGSGQGVSEQGVSGQGGSELDGAELDGADLRYWPAGDLAAGPSSGSYPASGMIVIPASTASCAGIALGLSKDLLQRAAEVNLKERRPVVIVPRETPVTRSHLLHLVELIDAGAVVLPASPGFYGAGAQAQAQQLIDFVAGKVLDAVGVPHNLFTRWTGQLNSR